MKVVCFGPGPQFKGGISNYNTSLAKAFDSLGFETHIVSWTQQYPAIIPREFLDKSSKKNVLENTSIQTHYITNYNNPFTWKKTIDLIIKINPDKVIFQWAIAIQGLPLGYIAQSLIKKGFDVVFDLHFVIQKEHSSIDRIFTKYGLSKSTSYVAHAYKTVDELKMLFPDKKLTVNTSGKAVNTDETRVVKLYHPIYDMFKVDDNFDVEAFKKTYNLRENVFLFFGFIRKYKGLHNVIQAFKKVAEQRNDVSLIICGESFWQTLDNTKISTKIKNAIFGMAKRILLKNTDDERNYNPLDLLKSLQLGDSVFVKNEFVANEDVHKYFQSSNAVILFYEYATPSGVESIGYNFNMPILATRVGHFPETIIDGENGYLAKANDIEDMAAAMFRYLKNPIPKLNVAKTAENMSWRNYALAIVADKN